MYKSHAFMALAALTFMAATAEEKPVRYDEQQAILAKPIGDTLVAGNEEKPPAISAAISAGASMRCPHHDDLTTLFTTGFAPISSALSASSSTSSQSLTTEPTETASDAELNDEGAAGPVAKASLFPLVVGLAAAVVML